jgi:glycosyltransferase involved in cell wall biosynthesis
MSQRIIFFHTLNDFSGSPKVLASVIKGLSGKGYNIDLYTSSSETGHLAGIQGVKYHTVFYRFTHNKFITLIRFILLQLRYFFIAFKYHANNDVVFYLNTILPFGAALGAKIIRKRIIYHVHEYPVKRNLIHKIAIYIFLKCADSAIFVSNYLFNSYNMAPKRKFMVYNALLPEFTEIAGKHQPAINKPFNIMMASSLKAYKGVDIFLRLAEQLSDHHFYLVLNASEKEIKHYFKRKEFPGNLEIIASVKDLHAFYTRANLVVNLSIPALCTESFGLTILEAMNYGIPVIVTPAGVITELVKNDLNGYQIDPLDLDALLKKINKIFSSEENYFLLSSGSRIMSKEFAYDPMLEKIETILKKI